MYSIPVGYNNKVMSPSLKFYDFESLKLDKKLPSLQGQFIYLFTY